MINKQLINERLFLIESYLKELKELAGLEKDVFLTKKIYSAATESYLRRILECIFDIGRHILAKKGHTELATEYKSIAKGIVKMGVINKEMEDKLIQMAGYRNRLVHMYSLVSEEELYNIIQSDLKDIEDFISSTKKFLKSI